MARSASTARRVAAAAVGARNRHFGPSDARTIEAKRDLAAAQVEDHIRALVASAPPLSDAQRARLAALLLAPPGT